MSVEGDLPPGMQIAGSGGVLEFTWQVPDEQSDSVTVTVVASDVQDPNSRTLMDVVIQVIQISPPVETTTVTESEADSATADDVDDAGSVDVSGTEVQTSTPTALNTNNQAPVLLSSINRAIAVGEPISIPAVAIDPDGFVPNVWSNDLPAGASLVDNGNGLRTFSWTPDDSQIGTHRIDLELQDAVDPNLQLTVQWNLEVFDRSAGGATVYDEFNPNDFSNFAPIFPNIPPQQVTVGDTFRLLVRPIDPEGFAPNLQLMSVPPGAEFTDAGNGARELVWTPSSDDLGVTALEFIAIDLLDESLSTVSTVELTVVGN